MGITKQLYNGWSHFNSVQCNLTKLIFDKLSVGTNFQANIYILFIVYFLTMEVHLGEQVFHDHNKFQVLSGAIDDT